MQKLVGFLRIPRISLYGVFESDVVVECMVANAVPCIDHLLLNLRMFAYVVAYHEECCFYPKTVKYLEYFGCSLRDWAIIEG